MLEPAPALVFEVGGTSLRAGLYDAGAVRGFAKRATPNHLDMVEADGPEILARLLEAIAGLGAEVLKGRTPQTVALAFPGPLAPDGRVMAAPTVWGSRLRGPVDLVAALGRIWPAAAISILNDVSAAGYRYLRDDRDDLCVVTVGSGVGAKIFIAGRPVTGIAGRGGEIGHLQVDFSSDAPICECGGRGHLGAVASGRASALHLARRAAADPAGFAGSDLARRVGGRLEAVDNEAIVAAARAGDPWTLALIDAMAAPLGWALAGIHLALGIERFVIVGGFATALGEIYRRALAGAAPTHLWDMGADWEAMIEIGGDERAALMGAGRFVRLNGAGAR